MLTLKSNWWQTAVAILIVVHLGPCLAVPLNQTRSIEPLGIVTPLPTTCYPGNTATLKEVRVSGCTTQPCYMTPSSWYEISSIYTPAYGSNTLSYFVRFEPSSGSSIYLLSVSNVDGTITAGRQYDLSYEVQIPTSIAGKTGRINFFLKDVDRIIFDRCFDISVSAS